VGEPAPFDGFAEARDPPPHALVPEVEEMPCEGQDVLAPLAQGRQLDRDHREAKVEVFAEGPASDLPAQVFVGRRDDANVDVALVVAAYPLELPLLQDPKELRLELRSDLADLVEEEGALVSAFEQSLAGAVGARERPLLVTEELRLEETLGERLAVHRDEWLTHAIAVVVNSASDELLARSALARDQHGARAARRSSYDLEDFSKRLALGDDGSERVTARELGAQITILARQLRHVESALHQRLQFGVVEGLLDVVERAGAHGLDGRRHARVGGDQDDGQIGLDLAGAAQHVDARCTRHAQVREEQVEGLLLECR
jgi:hypothetical protein